MSVHYSPRWGFSLIKCQTILAFPVFLVWIGGEFTYILWNFDFGIVPLGLQWIYLILQSEVGGFQLRCQMRSKSLSFCVWIAWVWVEVLHCLNFPDFVLFLVAFLLAVWSFKWSKMDPGILYFESSDWFNCTVFFLLSTSSALMRIHV